MKKFVITIVDETCVKNNRDPQATLLLEKAKLYGTVEGFEEYEKKMNNLSSQLNAVKELAVTPAELEILRLIRKKSKEEGKAQEDTIAVLKDYLRKVGEGDENRARAIKTMLQQ